jgi:phosphate transport system protein
MKLSKELIELLHIPTIFDEIDEMMHNISESLETADIAAAKKVFKQDKAIDRINKKLPVILEKYAQGETQDLVNIILVSRMIGKLERMGDLIKNIAEEIIFYYESKVIKHKKKNKKIEKKLGENISENTPN